MSKTKLLWLTEVRTILTKQGEERLSKLVVPTQEDEDAPKEGTKQWFLNMGIQPPRDLEETSSEIDSEGMVQLKDGEFEYDYFEIIVDKKSFLRAVEDADFGSEVTLKDGTVISVVEPVHEIFYQIKLVDMSFLERVWNDIKMFFLKKENQDFEIDVELEEEPKDGNNN